MSSPIWIVAACTLAAVLTGILTAVLRRRNHRRRDHEQINRKLREDSLDRALANEYASARPQRQQSPVSMRYEAEDGKDKKPMLRITWAADSIRKEYLVPSDQQTFLGLDHGRAAVSSSADALQDVVCELFPSGGGVYVRRLSSQAELVRGRRRTFLDQTGIRLASGDRLEMEQGVFLIELL